MPKKSIDRNPITIVSNQGTDSARSDITLISGLDVSVSANEVISSNELGGYLGNNVQVNLDDLTADAREGQPPKVGFEPVSFSNGSITVEHDGRPDWGQAKIVDKPPWGSVRKKWAEKREMPHYGFGRDMDDSPTSSYEVKYINEGGAYDTINLNYRDLSPNSYFGSDLHYPPFPALFPEAPFTHLTYPHIAQSVPRGVFQTGLEDSLIYPFQYQEPFVKNSETTQDLFNSTTSTSLGLSAGEGTSSLGVKSGQASICLSSPILTQTFEPNLSRSIVDFVTAGYEATTRDVGVCVSGILYPADRGVVALVRFPSDTNGVAQPINTPATTFQDINDRVISAINLGQGAGVNDGDPGGLIFNNTSSSTFPSRITGQYDLYELHTGNYIANSTNTGAIADLVGIANPSIGKVRLLSEENAFVPSIGPSTLAGGVPTLFSPYERHYSDAVSQSIITFNTLSSTLNPESTLGAYAIDSTGTHYECSVNIVNSSIDIIDDTGITHPTVFYAYLLKEDRSFLSYRMPVLKDYSPSEIPTPHDKRDRFFAKNTPNNEESNANYNPLFSTAGGYLTFGEEDNYSYQVARYRSVSLLLKDYINGISLSSLAVDSSEPEYNFGSIALIHFKTERAFEALVRDGIAPSDDDVYSKNLIDYTNLNNNLGTALGTIGEDGIEDGVDSFQPQSALSVFRPNLNFEQKLEGYPQTITIKTKAQAWGAYPVNQANDLRSQDTYFMWTSGVIYANPTTWRAYNGHPSNRGDAPATYSADVNHSRFHSRVEITQKVAQGADTLSEFDQTTSETAKPFYTVRPTAQILASDLTASDNLFSGKYDRLSDNTQNEYSVEPKHQQIWVSSSGLGGALAGDLVVLPKGDAVKAIDDLSQYSPKDGLCTFTKVGLRPSVMVNKPHRQFNNLGVEHIQDNLNLNTNSTVKKLLYHSARKISLLELYGERLNPNGRLIKTDTAIVDTSDIYTGSDTSFSTRVGEDYRENTQFTECYVWAKWENADPTTSIYTPKSSGQAFSIYRYDEEGYKVYQELELLPIDNDVANGYALELCTGWDWVKNTDDSDAGVTFGFKYSQTKPVYRPVENTDTRVSAVSYADAKFLSIKGVDYYIECHPSIPYDWNTNTNPNGGQPPTNFNLGTEPKTSIEDLGTGSIADLNLSFSTSITDATAGGPNYFSLYAPMSTATVDHGEYINREVEAGTPEATVDPTLGDTIHLFKLSANYNGTFTKFNDSAHPHPTTSVIYSNIFVSGERHFGHTINEVSPTGRREIPEYGNYTMDIRGFITVSGMGNSSIYAEDQLQAVPTDTRQPLVSLFTPRKDTQERFLDESYRVEHSLAHLFKNKGDDPQFNYQYGNHQNTTVDPPLDGNTDLRDNLIGPGIPNFGAGFNGGYIAFPVRDELNVSPTGQLSDAIDLMKYSFHGFAGYLRNSLHMRRINISSPLENTDWLEAQVSGFPNMTRNHLSGSRYGTPPRGVLIYPYQDFDGNTTESHGYNLSNSGAGTVNPLIDSELGFFLPNSNAGLSAVADSANHMAGNYSVNYKSWIDDDGNNGGQSLDPVLRHAQPTYSGSGFDASNESPEVGYLRAFDLNFGKSVERTPHLPYWDQDWTETTTSGETIDRLSTSVSPQGLIESEDWVRYKAENTPTFTPIKLRLVGIDWDMISYVDPQFPTTRRDGTVYTIDNKQYLMRKRVMRVFVKVPGLTTWLDVGVMNGEIGESYVQYAGDPTDTFGVMNENGATSDKTHPSIDGAGCCVSYKETFLVEEGLVALDLDLDVGFVPAFHSVGTDASSDTIASYDSFLGQNKLIYANNSDKFFSPSFVNDFATGKGGSEAPILVKVVLGNPESPKYEVHPNEVNALVNRDDLTDTTTLIVNVYEGGGNDEIYDLWPSPNKSYRGHSFPPDDRAPTWARRGLMGIEVLRPDGSNFDRDEVIERPSFASTNLFGSVEAVNSNTSEDDRSHYMLYRQSLTNASSYRRGGTTLTESIRTNRQSYTFDNDMLDGNVDFDATHSLSKKGEG